VLLLPLPDLLPDPRESRLHRRSRSPVVPGHAALPHCRARLSASNSCPSTCPAVAALYLPQSLASLPALPSSLYAYPYPSSYICRPAVPQTCPKPVVLYLPQSHARAHAPPPCLYACAVAILVHLSRCCPRTPVPSSSFICVSAVGVHLRGHCAAVVVHLRLRPGRASTCVSILGSMSPGDSPGDNPGDSPSVSLSVYANVSLNVYASVEPQRVRQRECL
jgi:hypothetical protein